MAREKQEGPVGVGGWLAFLVVILGLFTPLRVVASAVQFYHDPHLAASFGPQWPLMRGFEMALAATTIAGAWYLVWRLKRIQSRRTVRIVIAGLWILTLGSMTLHLVAVAALGGLPLGLLLSVSRYDFLRAIVFSSIWTAYFLTSRRVANTYPGSAEDVAEVFT